MTLKMIYVPVSEGEFNSGPELMLWRPHLDWTRLSWRIAWASMLPQPLTCITLGTGAVVLGLRVGTPTAMWLFGFVGVLAVAAGITAACINYECFEYDHQHGNRKPCFLEHVRGKYFYRPSDFADVSASTMHTANQIIMAVRDTHTGPGVVWLAPKHLQDIHSAAWNALTMLDRSRRLHNAVYGAQRNGAHDHPLRAAETTLGTLNHAIEHVLTRLLDAAALVRAWENKTTEAELGTRLQTELSQFPHGTITHTVHMAESALESMFVAIMTARDATQAGPFDWERSASTRPPQIPSDA